MDTDLIGLRLCPIPEGLRRRTRDAAPTSLKGLDTMTNEDRRQPHREGGESPPNRRARHRWMMLACFVPLLLIAAALILTGSVGIGSTVFVVGCVAMMAAMMFVMGQGRH